MKSGEKCSSGFREYDVKRLKNFVHVIAQGQEQTNPGGQKFDCNKKVLLL